jgi:hypothetical protein
MPPLGVVIKGLHPFAVQGRALAWGGHCVDSAILAVKLVCEALEFKIEIGNHVVVACHQTGQCW